MILQKLTDLLATDAYDNIIALDFSKAFDTVRLSPSINQLNNIINNISMSIPLPPREKTCDKVYCLPDSLDLTR